MEIKEGQKKCHIHTVKKIKNEIEEKHISTKKNKQQRTKKQITHNLQKDLHRKQIHASIINKERQSAKIVSMKGLEKSMLSKYT